MEKYTAQTCSCCGDRYGNPKGRAGLAIREWICTKHGIPHDRGINGSKNILAVGDRLLGRILLS
ncbi:zinc ribbon domain-containing protein [Moraxella canis]|uniref:zinc ribbon domain-containing protein n=1 Tax=Moraxella canis TaxID=90239 RepID=UPI000993FB69|nr:zinc ribbon domain-containing protein [Moraxella canis]